MEQNAYQGIPGLPSPSTKDHSPYIESIVMAYDWLKKHKGTDSPISDQKADLTIYVSFLITDTEKWTDKFRDSQRNAAKFPRDKDNYWRAIALGLSTPQTEKVCLEIFPDLDREKYFPPEIPTPTPQKITPQPLPKTKLSRRRPREETIVQFITSHTTSINYLQGFIFVSRHTKNHFSARGREVYPYGQEYVSRNLEISLRTVTRIFSWLQRHHIIFKRSNENPELKKSATWFVCTSWKQSTYFLDPEGRRSKKGSPRSRRK